MSQILNKVRDVDPNNSDAVKDVLSTFFHNLTKHTDVDCNRWLQALEDIINRFPRFCGSHRTTIETYLSNFIDSSNYFNVIEAAKCAHALQQVRPPQEKTATAKSCWREHLALLCNAAHKLLGSLFPNSVDIYKGNPQKSQLQSSATSPLYTALAQITSVPKTYNNNNLNKQALLGIRLRNVFVLLQATLVETYPVAKPIQPRLVIDVITRALSLSSGAKEAQDNAVSVKRQALRTLDALVACLGPNLIPFSSLIFKFVILTLKWCTENLNEEVREVRRSAYDSLRCWLITLHTYRLADSARGRSWEDELTQHIITDITPQRRLVQLTMRAQSTKRLSKKAKRKQANAMLEQSSIASYSNDKVPLSQESNDEMAVAALDFAETFLNVCGVFLKPATHKLLQERIVRECYSLTSYSAPRALGLVRALDALRRAAPPAGPPPAHHCLQLYSSLLHQPDRELSKFCSQALLDMRLQLHCSPPTLNFALQVPRTEKPVDQPKLSSRNRAALESMLGAERVPKDKTDDIIDLDEPSKKRARTEHDEKEINISSESSVEISDESDDDVQEVVHVDGEGEDNEESDENSEEAKNVQDTDTEDVVDTGKETSVASTLANNTREAINDEESGTQDTEESKTNDESQDSTSKGELSEATSKEKSQDASSEQLQENETTDNSNDEESTSASNEKSMDVEDSASQEESVSQTSNDIHNKKTQMPLNASGNSAEEPRSPPSMEVEVAYDFPNTGETRVNIIEKIEDDNLPSTNDTDDVPITCGQVVKSSQEVDVGKKTEIENKENEEPKVNGDGKVEKTGDAVTNKIVGAKEVSVEDMLADFVDEVIEDNKT